MKYQPNCVILSILCAWTWRLNTKNLVRIGISNISQGLDHAQAEAFIDDRWIPLTESWTGTNLMIETFTRHYPEIEPYRYLTLEDWISEQLFNTI
jgi:hypothetical protein